ncbi:MAG: hypothetical protein LBR70_04455 [Lactobacillaceae bacterium]|jgi:RimJ/RimL family protein N-acetyltransferase|nr:hypothetical protein [Lactobacillaceae bacterium]
MNDDISNNIYLAEPNAGHYEAFIEACAKMQSYLNDDTKDEVGRRESSRFVFADKELGGLTREEFNERVVTLFSDKRKDERDRPVSPRDSSRKILPEYFYFVMDGDKIAGSVTATPKLLSEKDKENGAKSYEKWNSLSENGVRVETSTVLLDDYKGKGLSGKVKKEFFDKLRALGVEEVVATVLADNENSNMAQKKLVDRYGGKSYRVEAWDESAGNIKIEANRYLVSTDTSGNGKEAYRNLNNEAYMEQVKAKKAVVEAIKNGTAKVSVDTKALHQNRSANQPLVRREYFNS